jgi:hypothetical protein
MMGRQVAGVVTETDLLAAEDKAARDARLDAETPGAGGDISRSRPG